MKNKVILFAVLLVIIAFFAVPFSYQKTTIIKAPFLTIYRQLENPDSWEKWVPELKQAVLTDSNKISLKKDSGVFTINYANLELTVKLNNGTFEVKEHNDDNTNNYSYAIAPGKDLKNTSITINKSTSFFKFFWGNLGPASFSDTHVDDFKKWIETDSLYYGYKLFKTGVPEANLIEIKKVVAIKDRYTEAAKSLDALRQYIKANNIKQAQPLIGQFLPKGTDSNQVNVGMFIDREAVTKNNIVFTRMPMGGPLWAAKYHGTFSKRQRAYNGIQQYFTDHIYQSAILPFEIYLDNKLPTSDTSKVNIQVNFSTYF